MSNNIILFQKIDGFGIITVDSPATNNTINSQLAEELDEVCADINHDDEIKAVIVTGAGQKTFCAGTDLEEFSSTVRGSPPAKLLTVATPVADLSSPVIAAINGDALGQGLELALACDIRIAVETAKFALPQIMFGLIPWDGVTQRLPRLIGKARAMEMIFTGKSIDSAEAYRIGLVNQILPPEKLLLTAMTMARTIASKAPLALRYAKEAIHKGLNLTLAQGLSLEADLYFLLQTTEDRKEGIRAFLEKRPPRFQGK